MTPVSSSTARGRVRHRRLGLCGLSRSVGCRPTDALKFPLVTCGGDACSERTTPLDTPATRGTPRPDLSRRRGPLSFADTPEAHMEPTGNRMLSHPDSEPRPLTAREQARINWALRHDPPVYARPVKTRDADVQRIVAPQPWQVREAA